MLSFLSRLFAPSRSPSIPPARPPLVPILDREAAHFRILQHGPNHTQITALIAMIDDSQGRFHRAGGDIHPDALVMGGLRFAKSPTDIIGAFSGDAQRGHLHLGHLRPEMPIGYFTTGHVFYDRDRFITYPGNDDFAIASVRVDASATPFHLVYKRLASDHAERFTGTLDDLKHLLDQAPMGATANF